jgi:streptogramin lyase
VSRIDPRAGAVIGTIPTGFGPRALTAFAGSLWVSNTEGAAVQRLDPTTSQVTETIPTPAFPDGLLPVAGSLWVASQVGPELARIDPRSNAVADTHAVGDHPRVPADQLLALADGALWLPIFEGDRVVKVAIPL